MKDLNIFKKNEYTNKEIIGLNRKLKKMNFCENQFNEAKYFNPKTTKLTLESKEEKLVKPIVGFLNSFSGTGKLYLGIQTGPRIKQFKNIIPIKKEVIKNEDQLQDLIVDNINCYPTYELEKPKVKINKISFENNSNIFIIKISRISKNIIFYSKLTDYVYKRHNDSTYKLNFIDTTNFIESKKNSIIYTHIDNCLLNKELKQIELDICCWNAGNTPGKLITAVIELEKNQYILNYNCKKGLIERDSETEKNVKFGYSINQRCSMPLIYPNLTVRVGKIILTLKKIINQQIKIKVTNFESTHETNQFFIIEMKKNIIKIHENIKKRKHKIW